jgi:hypothetical protein
MHVQAIAAPIIELARDTRYVGGTVAVLAALHTRTYDIRHKEQKADQLRTRRASRDEFIHRFLQHVLPRGFRKVRFFVGGIPLNATMPPG